QARLRDECLDVPPRARVSRARPESLAICDRTSAAVSTAAAADKRAIFLVRILLLYEDLPRTLRRLLLLLPATSVWEPVLESVVSQQPKYAGRSIAPTRRLLFVQRDMQVS